MDSKKTMYVTNLSFICCGEELIMVKDIADSLYWLFQEPLNVLREYMQCHFFCCKKCQLLRASLHQELNKREKIRHKRSNVCWHLLSGINPRRDVQQYIDQVIGIFKVSSFCEGFMALFLKTLFRQ